jgi:aspartyl-tRNA(Asn)/glutamyl-tRNA(Gln) amidotransferase subunit A
VAVHRQQLGLQHLAHGIGVSIPCGAGDAGMPLGFLLSGLARADEQLLSVALGAEPIIRGKTI